MGNIISQRPSADCVTKSLPKFHEGTPKQKIYNYCHTVPQYHKSCTSFLRAVSLYWTHNIARVGDRDDRHGFADAISAICMDRHPPAVLVHDPSHRVPVTPSVYSDVDFSSSIPDATCLLLARLETTWEGCRMFSNAFTQQGSPAFRHACA